MTYLLDTNVISELRRRQAHAGVCKWFDSIAGDDVYLSVIVIAELCLGVERLRRRDPTQAAGLDAWIAGITRNFAERILPVTLPVAEEWSRLNVPDPLPILDGFMAATARVHGLTLVTRNIRDLARTGVSLLDPWAIA